MAIPNLSCFLLVTLIIIYSYLIIVVQNRQMTCKQFALYDKASKQAVFFTEVGMCVCTRMYMLMCAMYACTVCLHGYTHTVLLYNYVVCA